MSEASTLPRYSYADLPGLLALMSGDEKHDPASESTLDVIWVLYDRVLRVSPRPETARVLGLGVAREELRHYGAPQQHQAAHGLDAASLRQRIAAFAGIEDAGRARVPARTLA